jgi:putative transposase
MNEKDGKKYRKSTAPKVTLTEAERQQLEGFSGSRTLPKFLVQRAEAILLTAAGKTNVEIAKRVGLSRSNVGKWRRRFAAEGIQGLYDVPRSGRPRTISDERVAGLLRATLDRKPPAGSHWSTRLLSEATGMSKSTVHRIWNAFGLQPHRQKNFTLSNDPFFVEKVVDVVGLYLNPPQHAIVLCVDEKSQCQALERTQPVLPMGLGYLEGVTSQYIRHGTLTLFAALDVASGQVLSRCTARHRHIEFLAFLEQIDSHVPADLTVHIVMDNYATHRHAKVARWFVRHPRFHPHFIPTYSSWLNQVERWFGLITQRAIRRDSFRSTQHLRERIQEFTRQFNKNAHPFSWTATADSIFAKLGRLCSKISGTQH